MIKLTKKEAAQAKLVALRICALRVENGTRPVSAWDRYEEDCECIDALTEDHNDVL